MAKIHFIDRYHHHDHRDHRERAVALIGDDLVDDDHHQHRRQDRQQRQHQGPDENVAQDRLFQPYQSRDPHQAERLIIQQRPTLRAEQQHLTIPDLRKAELIDRNADRFRTRQRVLQPHHVARRIGPDHQSGTAISEQQHHRPGGLHLQQMPPAKLGAARPQPVGPRPFHQGGRWRGFALRKAQIVTIEFNTVVARRRHHRENTDFQRRGPGRGIALGRGLGIRAVLRRWMLNLIQTNYPCLNTAAMADTPGAI